MHIKVIGVGKIKEKYLKEGLKEYGKRLSGYCRWEIVEVDDEKTVDGASLAEDELVRQKEGERILRQVKDDTFVILLDLGGKEFDSEGLADYLAKLALRGKSDITFIIGGSLGVSETVRKRADLRLSFSKFTFPHQLMRLILAEQVYRSFRINRGEPYHK